MSPIGRYAAARGLAMPKSVALEREIESEAETTPTTTTEAAAPMQAQQLLDEEDDIDAHVERVLAENEKLKGRFVKVSRGKYMLLRTELPPKQTFVRVLLDHVMVRVGGGWQDLQQYCEKHV